MKLMYVRRLFGVNSTTSYFSGLPPSIPGEPIGIPGTARPVAFGFSARKRLSATAGACASLVYPARGAAGGGGGGVGEPSPVFSAPLCLVFKNILTTAPHCQGGVHTR